MIGGRYRPETEISRGAFGIIYKGIYEKNGEQVAIKIDYSSNSTLKNEIRIIQYLSMASVKNIPNIYWYGQFNNKPCVVMTLYECSLYDYKKKCSPTIVQLSKIIWLLLDIFENIHKHWVVHRDIKPQNFMIKGGEFFLIDFGLATFYMNDNGEHCHDSGTQTMIGSPYFASLRIHEGHSYSRRDDLISLGYILLFMTGFSWDIKTDVNVIGSPLDLSYTINRELQCKKENIYTFLQTMDDDIKSPFQHYMEYVYRMEYAENPKYTPMKQLFSSFLMEN